MRKWRWMLVLLGAVCVSSAISVAEDISLHFSGHLAAGQGTCQQITDTQISCQVSPGSPITLDLEAAVSPTRVQCDNRCLGPASVGLICSSIRRW